jgi:hypothetical protein
VEGMCSEVESTLNLPVQRSRTNGNFGCGGGGASSFFGSAVERRPMGCGVPKGNPVESGDGGGKRSRFFFGEIGAGEDSRLVRLALEQLGSYTECLYWSL